jgi:hypothetical protein
MDFILTIVSILFTTSAISCQQQVSLAKVTGLDPALIAANPPLVAANPHSVQVNPVVADTPHVPKVVTSINGKPILANRFETSPITSFGGLQNAAVVSALGSLAGLTNIVSNAVPVQGAAFPVFAGVKAELGFTTTRPPPTTTFPGYLVDKPYPFVLPPPDIPYFGSKWVGPWGYPIGHYQAFRGTGQYITHYSYYPLSYFGSLMAPFAYGVSGKK